MSTRSSSLLPTLQAVHSALEELRSHLVDLEAVAHAAEEALQDVPYTPRTPPLENDAPYTDAQLGGGRLQALVAATATAARVVLQEADRLIDRVYKARTLGRGSNGNGSSRAGETWRPELLRRSPATSTATPRELT